MTPLPRPDEPSLVAFLQRNHRAFLFCRDDDGHPIGYPMRSVTYEPGRLYFATYSKSAKVRHMLADPEAVCVVISEGQTDADWPSWVSLRGAAVVYRPSREEIEPMLESSSTETRVPQSVVTKVHDRLLSGTRCFIRLEVQEVHARG